MSQQSYQVAFVSNTGTLLASGATVESLALAQIAILDGNSHVATTTPTYAKNKALEIVWGTPDLGDLPLMSGFVNQNEYSKLIKGKSLTGFRGHAASRPQNEVWTVGWSGDDADTDTLFAKPGEVKYLYIKLTGGVIDKLYSKQGITRMFAVKAGVTDDCGDPCTNVDCRLLLDDLIKQINYDPLIGTHGVNGVSKNRLIKASSIVSCGTPPTLDTDTDYRFKISVCDTGDDAALGNIQSQYPDDVVKVLSRFGSTTTYEIVRDTNSLPTAFSNAGVVVIPDCDTCPTGYSLAYDDEYAYTVQRSDAGSSGNLTTVKSDYGIASSTESGARVNYEFGSSTYVLVSDTALTVSGVDTLTFLGRTRGTCVLTTPTTAAWQANGTLTKFGKDFTITLADDCDTSRLTDLQAAYPDLTISQISESDNGCVNSFTTTVFSQAVEEGCSSDQLIFLKPQAFEGIEWQEVTTLTGSDCKCGIRIDVAFTNRTTNECTFDYFPGYEFDTINVQISSFDPDYNKSPDELQWVVKKIQNVKFPSGSGSFVRDMEKQSKSYFLQERSFDPVVREIGGYQFIADPKKYYDEYVLEFEFSYKVGGWTQSYIDSYHLHVFFPEGTGKTFESAINGYIASASLGLDAVVL